MILTTNPLDTIRIKKELGVVSVSLSGLIDYQEPVETIISKGLQGLEEKALNLGADAISGIKIEVLDPIRIQKRCQILIYGTAHKLRDIEEL
jgi:uncharacterized protein YbjQ (UPF0145 family)